MVLFKRIKGGEGSIDAYTKSETDSLLDQKVPYYLGRSSKGDNQLGDKQSKLVIYNNNIFIGNKRIQEVGDPQGSTDAVNKRYVDNAINDTNSLLDQKVPYYLGRSSKGENEIGDLKSKLVIRNNDISIGGQRIREVGDPQGSLDAVNRRYVDNAISIVNKRYLDDMLKPYIAKIENLEKEVKTLKGKI